MSAHDDPTVDPHEFLNTEQLSVYLAVVGIAITKSGLEQWRHRGLGPHPTPIIGKTYYRRTDVDAWLQAQRSDVDGVVTGGAK